MTCRSGPCLANLRQTTTRPRKIPVTRRWNNNPDRNSASLFVVLDSDYVFALKIYTFQLNRNKNAQFMAMFRSYIALSINKYQPVSGLVDEVFPPQFRISERLKHEPWITR